MRRCDRPHDPRSRPRRRGWVPLLLCLGALSTGAADRPPRSRYFVDPKDGLIDGRAALNVFPVDFGAAEAERYLDPVGLEAHLVPVDDPEAEQVYPAGTWFLPPSGRYRVRLEGGWRMSPYSVLLLYGSGDNPAGLRGQVPIGPAGRVALPSGWDPASDEVFELLHAGQYLERRFPRWEISRRVPTAKVGEGLLMPEGTAFGGIWNRRDESYEAISRPFRVRQGETTRIALERPGRRAHVVAELRRDAAPTTAADRGVTVHMVRDGRRSAPALKVLTADRAYAVWYGLEPGPAILDAETPHGSGVRRPLSLEAGRIDRLVADLGPLPALDVLLDLPAPLREGKLALELRLLPDGEPLERRSLAPETEEVRFERMPPELLEVRLGTRFGDFAEQADLRSGADGVVTLAPDLIELRGTVYRGDETHAAEVEFTTAAREAAKAEAGDDGAYEVVALRQLRAVTVTLEGRDGAPFFDFYPQPIALSREGLDFHFPEVDFVVRVIDATTGLGIPGAAVGTRNTFTPPGEEGAAERDPDGAREPEERVIAQAVAADPTGLARLPPLRRGRVEIQASAEGYQALSEPVVVEVLDETTGQEFEVRLQRPDAGRPNAATAIPPRPRGRVAAGAELYHGGG